MTMLVMKYGYMFRLFLSHPQANMITEYRYIKCTPLGAHFIYLNSVTILAWGWLRKSRNM